jgi:hypothetical protein
MSQLLSLFPIRTLASVDDSLRKNEVLVILRNMRGTDHAVAIANTQCSSTLALMAENITKVYHEQISLFGENTILTGNETISQLASLLEKTGNVIQYLVKDPKPIVVAAFQPDILLPRRAYGGGVGEGW